MHFKRHSNLTGEHAFLSPSYYHWINYTPERLVQRWHSVQATLIGIQQHQYARDCIDAGLMQSDESTLLGRYINDCIRFGMSAEVILYYSPNCFGTADAIAFENHKLRISDLKTGQIPGSIHQLEVYATLFCLEYDIDPYDIRIELRLYQGNEVAVYDADPEVILFIQKKIIIFDHRVNQLKREEAS
jgi:hypothetical protein